MLSSIAPLILFVMVATLSPGGAITLVTASGANFSLPLLAGISFGLALMAVAAAGGLGSLILAAPSLQLAMKLVGSPGRSQNAGNQGAQQSPKSLRVFSPASGCSCKTPKAGR